MPTPPSNPPSPALVSVARARDYEDRAALRAAIEASLEPLGGIAAFVKPGSRVLLKPNFVRASPAETACVTHPAVIAEAARLVHEAGAARVMVGDSPAFGSAKGAARKMGLMEELDPIGAEVVELTKVRRVRKGMESGVFRALNLSGEILDAEAVINLPKAKAHCQMVLTGAVKNLFGCIPGRRKAVMHCLVKNSRYLFGRMLTDNARTVGASLHLMDAVVAHEGQGPCRGRPRPWGWMMASQCPIAMDRIMAAALGYEQNELPHLVAAAHMSVGPKHLREIELIGAAMEDLTPESWLRAEMISISFNPLRLLRGYFRHRRAWRAAS